MIKENQNNLSTVITQAILINKLHDHQRHLTTEVQCEEIWRKSKQIVQDYFCQQMHCLLKHKMLQFVFKVSLYMAPTCFGPSWTIIREHKMEPC